MENHYNPLMNYAVKITYCDNYGSGVAFRTNDKIIVLTAYHIINEESFSSEDLFINIIDKGQEKKIDFKVIKSSFDIENDLAAFIIDSQFIFSELRLVYPFIEQRVKMYGFPHVLQDSKDIHSYMLEGKVNDILPGKLFVSLDEKLGSIDTGEKETVDGYSGSGVYQINGKNVKLCGIETNVLNKSVSYNAVCGASVDVIFSLLVKLGVDEDVLVQNDVISDVVKNSDLYMSHLVTIDVLGSKKVSLEKLQNEYREGISARPEHIRKRLDVIRNKWIEQVEINFEKSNIVLIRGASGQGKTSLAYRYLLERYAEEQIICIQKLTNENSIWAILNFLKRELEDREYVLYYDVQPGDTFWGIILNAISMHLPDARLLVTIREDDYNSSNISRGSVSYEEISLELYEDEAREIYSQYEQNTFISFNDLWKTFGNGGPLLEFIYLINHSMTLEAKINNQITRIGSEIDEREWFNVLAVIAIAGQYDLSIKLDVLFEKIKLKNASKLLQQFEKEFFVKISDNGERIKCLHSVRAHLIIKCLEGKFGFNYLQALLLTLSVIDNSTIYLLLEYFSKNKVSEEVVDEFSNISFEDLSVVEDILRGLLWLSITDYLSVNKKVIEEGNRIFTNNYVMIALGDITGFIDTRQTTSDLLKIYDKKRPGIIDEVNSLINRQTTRFLEYEYPKRFLENIANSIIEFVEKKTVNTRSLGYILFWANKLGVSISISSEIDVKEPKDYMGLLGLVKGLISQGLYSKADEIKDKYEKTLLSDANIVSLYIKDNEIFAEVVPNYYPESKANRSIKDFGYNEKCMYVINMLSCLYPQLERYNVTLLGTDILDINIPDTEKHIPKENLPDKWITELNGICHRILEYENSLDDWKDVFDNINSYRNKIIDLFEELLRQLGKFYRKGTFDPKQIDQIQAELNKGRDFSIPKCARDKFGISNDADNLKVSSLKESAVENEQSETLGKVDRLWIGDACNKFFSGVNNYINGLYSMMEGLANNKDPKEYCRLQFFNIVSSYELYYQFLEANKSFFVAYDCAVNEEKELIVLEKIVALTKWIYLNGYRHENNIVYDAYESFKKNKRSIDDYLKKEIGDYTEVQEIEFIEETIVLHVNMSESDTLIEKIYYEVQKLVGNCGTISAERGYLFNRIRKICFAISDDKYKDFLFINIPINSFTLAKDVEQLHKYVIGADRQNTIVPPAYMGNGAIASVIYIAGQLVQINEALFVTSKYSIPETIDSINKMLKLELDEIGKTIKVFPDYAELYQDIMMIRSLNLITIDYNEYKSNIDLLEKFISKYGDSIIT